jgi:hypothetical protein
MKILTIITFLFLSYGCSRKSGQSKVVEPILVDTTSQIISINSQTSPCQGFPSLAKAASIGYQKDSAYCGATKFYWAYSSSLKVLYLLHTRIQANCAAMLTMGVVKSENTYTAIESDSSKGPANCDCTFDTYCEVPNINTNSICIYFEPKHSLNYSQTTPDTLDLDLTQTEGSLIADTSHAIFCH